MFFSEIYESWREIQEEKYEVILRRLKDANAELGKLVLDLGSSVGFLADYLVKEGIEVEIVALDVEVSSLKKNNSDHLLIADGSFLPFKDGVFDSLFCIDVAHLLDDLSFDCVKDGGIVVLALPTRYDKEFAALLNSVRGCKVEEVFEINGRERERVAILRRIHT